ENADQGEAGGRLRELYVGRLIRLREADGGDDLAGFEGGLEQALEEIVGRDLAFVCDDGGAEADQPGRGVGGRIVVGDRAADGAAVADLRIADAVSEHGEGGDRTLHHR